MTLIPPVFAGCWTLSREQTQEARKALEVGSTEKLSTLRKAANHYRQVLARMAAADPVAPAKPKDRKDIIKGRFDTGKALNGCLILYTGPEMDELRAAIKKDRTALLKMKREQMLATKKSGLLGRGGPKS